MELIFNTKQDYFNYLVTYPNETKGALQLLLDSRFIWKTSAVLEEDAEGITDATHRVIGDIDREQQELIEDDNARIFNLGFTVEEVEGIIENA